MCVARNRDFRQLCRPSSCSPWYLMKRFWYLWILNLSTVTSQSLKVIPSKLYDKCVHIPLVRNGQNLQKMYFQSKMAAFLFVLELRLLWIFWPSRPKERVSTKFSACTLNVLLRRTSVRGYKSFAFCCEEYEWTPTLAPPISKTMRHFEKLLISLDPQLVHSDLTKFEGDPIKALWQVRSHTIGAKWPKSAKNVLSIQDGGFPVRFRASATLTFLTVWT